MSTTETEQPWKPPTHLRYHAVPSRTLPERWYVFDVRLGEFRRDPVSGQMYGSRDACEALAARLNDDRAHPKEGDSDGGRNAPESAPGS